MYRGLRAVREGGNILIMLNVPMVQRVACLLGFPETAKWIDGNLSCYIKGLSHRFKPDYNVNTFI
jgi:hypothetical protein